MSDRACMWVYPKAGKVFFLEMMIHPPDPITNEITNRPWNQSKVKKIFYCPQQSCGKVMFLHVSVILFTGGEYQADTPRGKHPPSRGRQPPWADIPPPLSRRPQADTPLRQTPPRQTLAGQNPPSPSGRRLL